MLIKYVKLSAFVIVLSFLWGGCVHEPIEGRLSPEQSAARAEKSARIHTELAAEYYYRGQYKVALEEIETALESKPNYAPAFSVLGLVYMTLGEDGKAQFNFDRALKIDPENPELHNNYGWFLCERFPEQIDRAINHFMTALKDPLYETRHVAYANAGICELKRSNFSKASLYFDESLSLQPNYRPALVGLIEMDFKVGKIEAAQSKLSEYLQKYQPTARSLWLGMQIERIAGNIRAANSYLFQLQKNFPNSSEYRAAREGGL
ncbi:type IV pilus assembly protein PilF [Nitrosomonas sp. Nm51]|uniref:type IV pilus biogenesis/stability protein PilW n=1 Tax=Nitrosomonas sp. Nm51 TaxID=133720 RepID=UPI0008B42C39|nr:type IV pilus biogenesis/stability protein PilW [Nitrosomonas sp. Nm51]SER12485.1 type IV pilus assembly protein PilF [Nitrosomonas sp. Nm51]